MKTSLEICAGAGGQALGIEQAGFDHVALVEIDSHACNTLRLNRPKWNVMDADVNEFNATKYLGVDLLAGGVPCPPFSKAGKQLGKDDERDLFPAMLRIAGECSPKAIMIENVPGLLEARFRDYRLSIESKLRRLGYVVLGWKLFNASDFGVPQLRPRVVMVALRQRYVPFFYWPEKHGEPITVATALAGEMGMKGWQGIEQWKEKANKVAPTIVGGSKKHGGPDLGPTRAKRAWEELGVDGKGIANEPPDNDFMGLPRLTLKMVATLQGFPPDWQFSGKKTATYRQIGNAFPPPVARAIGDSIRKALLQESQEPCSRKELEQIEFRYYQEKL
jgi:DNA (cytosine-5)-methyltransferase 1